MVPSSRLCQLLLRLRQISRLEVLASSHLSLLLLAICGFLGCWQEIRYEPSNLADQKPEEPATQASPPVPLVADQREFPQTDAAEEIAGELISPPVTPTENESDRESLPASPELAAELPPVDDTPAVLSDQGESPSPVFEQMSEDVSTSDAVLDQPLPAVSALAIWRLSSEWSMGVALEAKKAQPERYGKHHEAAQREADRLGIDLPELNELAKGDDSVASGLDALLNGAGSTLISELAERHSAAHAALAELAVKSHSLLLNYVPASPELEPIIAAIARAAKTSRLPESVWGELVQLLQQQAKFREVKSAIFKLHKTATIHLESAAAE